MRSFCEAVSLLRQSTGVILPESSDERAPHRCPGTYGSVCRVEFQE
jgi:hypothetical protein